MSPRVTAPGSWLAGLLLAAEPVGGQMSPLAEELVLLGLT